MQIEEDKIQFRGYNVVPNTMRSDNSVRVEIDTNEQQRKNLRNIFLLNPDTQVRVTIEPLEE